MNTLKLLTLLTILLLPFGVRAQDSVTLFSQSGAKATYTWAVPMDRLQQTPAWTPSAGAPPLSISKAVAIAVQRLKAANPEFKRYDVLSLSLVAASRTADQPADHWYYKIELVPVIDGNRLYRLQYVAVVLLDGTLVEPRVKEGGKR
jgi:hypothetical protein